MSSSKCGMKRTYTLYLICFFALSGFSILSTVAEGQEEKIRACYFMGGKSQNFSGDSVDPFLCTHIILANGVVTPDGIETTFSIDLEQYKAVAKLKVKNPSLKVMISLQHGFPSVVDEGSMTQIQVIERFSVKAVTFLEKLNMDGLDLDWEFPQVYEKVNYIKFIQILAKYLHTSNMLLSMALPAMPYSIDNGFDIPTINRSVDFVTVMTYDYNAYNKISNNVTAYNSPLYTPKGEDLYKSTADSITYFLYQGLSKEKILMGIPTYGRSWTLTNPDVHGLHSPAIGLGPYGPVTSSKGTYIYADVCVSQKKGATTVQDEMNVGEYIYNGSVWVAFEGKFSIQKKMQWLKQRDLAGYGIWAYQLDDVYNLCGYGPMPLLRWLKSYIIEPKTKTKTLFFHSEH